jgi:hypothetical protein
MSAAVSRRAPISLHTIVARTEAAYTYDTNVWDFSLVQGEMDTWEQETGEWMSEPRPYTTSECTPCGAG